MKAEADSGFRLNRQAQDAIEQVRFFINPPRSYEWVIEGDVEDCFGQHPSRAAAGRVAPKGDRQARAAADPTVPRRRDHEAQISGPTPSGTPQGAILSLLLANIALSVLDRRFEDAWNACTPHQRKRRMAKGHASYRMIRYADDFVILVRGTKAQAQVLKQQTAEFTAEQMRLTLSPEKTRITHVDDGFDFLGFRLRRRPRGRTLVACSFPSERSLREIKHRIKELTGRSTIGLAQIGRASCRERV